MENQNLGLGIDINWEELEKGGLNKEDAEREFPKVVRFLVDAEKLSKKSYLSETVLQNQREAIEKLQGIAAQYPDVKGLLGNLFLRAVKDDELSTSGIIQFCDDVARLGIFTEWTYLGRGVSDLLANLFLRTIKDEKLSTFRILQFCDEMVRLGVFVEWAYLGKEIRKWRRINDQEGEGSFIHKSVLGAGIHIYDFRNKENRRQRHFLPRGWHNESQRSLTAHLISVFMKNEEDYMAKKDAERAQRAEATAEAEFNTAAESNVEPESEETGPHIGKGEPRKRSKIVRKVTGKRERKPLPGSKVSRSSEKLETRRAAEAVTQQS